MVAIIASVLVILLTLVAEILHGFRVQRLAKLAFGNRGPSILVYLAPVLRTLSMGAVCWGLITLSLLPGKVHRADKVDDELRKHVIVMLDVSPSMRLVDAGKSRDISRSRRGWNVLKDFFKRIPIQQYRVSVVAVYNGAIPVVVDTADTAVFENIMTDLPMHHAFKTGETDLFAGLKEVARIAKPWRPKSTSVIVLSDGDTVPGKGMPEMPASVSDVLVVGVGDEKKGSFIAGKQSRQDVSTLKQLAVRLSGKYLNGNGKPLSANALGMLLATNQSATLTTIGTREIALWAIAVGSILLAILPLLLHYLGTRWAPGVRHRVSSSDALVTTLPLYKQSSVTNV